MILTKLKEYADTQMDLPPIMYGEGRVRWIVNIEIDGTLDQLVSWGGDTKETKRGELMTCPQVPAKGAGIKPRLLADNGEYVLGVARRGSKPSDPQKVAQRHNSFKTLIHACAESTQNPYIKAIEKFLTNWDPENCQSSLPDDFDPADIVTFRVGTIIPGDAKAQQKDIEDFWAQNAIDSSDDESKLDEHSMTCLITGEFGPVAKRMPIPIKGIPGKRAETALVSANQVVFTSYKLKNSLTSPISYDAAEKFSKALNYLLISPDTHLRIGDVIYVFWTREPDDLELLEFFSNPSPQAVKNLLSSATNGQEVYGIDANEFYALSLCGNNARVVIRDWLKITVPKVQENLKRWFCGQKIVDAYGKDGKPLGVYSLAASAFRDPAKEMLPAVPTALMKTALQNIRLPDELLAKLVRRNRAEREVTYPRVSLIKLILTTQGEEAMSNMDKLNPSPNLEGKDSQAYQCGRLLAELEALQRAAIGKVNASLTDRYYGAASSTPATAFPSLMRNRQAHLSKLRKSKMGTFLAIDERIEEITSYLPTFPKTLNMQQQGLFALGYYHQRAHNRASAKSAVPAANA